MVVALSTCSCSLGGVPVYMHVIYRVCIRAFSGPLLFSYTVLSRANAYGRSQLKRQNLGWAVTRKKCLNRSNYFRARAHPGYEVGSHGPESTCIVGSSVLRQGHPDSGEGCIRLQSGPTRSLVAKFLQRSVVACSARISCCRGETLRTRPRTGVCEPDVVAPKAHQNYVSSADLPSDSLRKNLAWWAVTRRTLKNRKIVKSGGGGGLARVWALARVYAQNLL